MLDPRVDHLARVLIHHSSKLRAGEKVLLESYNAPLEGVAALVRAIGEVGALPLVETRQNRVLRALYRAATEEQMRLISELELARMNQMDHAGTNETSLLMALHPELVDLGRLSPDHTVWPQGVGGEGPRDATAAHGEELLSACPTA